MAMLDPRMLVLRIIEMVMLSILFGIGASWCWVLWNLLKGEPLLPERPLVERRKTPWSSGSVLLVFLLYIATNILMFQGYMWLTGRPPADETPATPPSVPAVAVKKTASPPADNVAVPSRKGRHAGESEQPPGATDEGVPRKEAKNLSLFELMSIQAAVSLFLLLLVPKVLKGTSGARLRDFGLGWDHLGLQAAIGTVAILFLIPIIFATQYGAVKLLGPVDEHFRHPVERMLREQFTGGVAGLALFTAVILAPMFEELMFRGIFQTWLIDLLDRFGGRLVDKAMVHPNPGGIEYIADEADATALEKEMIQPTEPDNRSAYRHDERATPEAVDPDRPRDYWMPEDQKESLPPHKFSGSPPASSLSVGFAITLTSLVFAMLHAGQWPAPIPIFFLSLGLGLVYHRTGSLLAAICMHAIFNGSSTLTLIWALLIGEPTAAEKEVPPPAIQRNVPGENVKLRTLNVDRPPK